MRDTTTTMSNLYIETSNGLLQYNSTNASDPGNETETTTTFLPDEVINEFLLPWWQQTIFILAFLAILLVAAVGNLIVIWIVLAHKRMRTVTNYFLVNLAVADFLISVLNMIFTFVFLLYQDWWFGGFFCKFSMFISPCTISVSVLTFMAIAVDRYTAIMHPLRPRMPRRHVIAAICVIWFISIALSVPNLIYADTELQLENFTVCKLHWSTEEDLVYNYLLLVLNYVFPLVTLTVTYTRVGFELWGSQAIGEETSVHHERVKSKRKVVKMMIVVVVIFAICWLPMHTFFILSNYYARLAKFRYIQQIYIVLYLMAMSNSMYNPIIYCWMNSKFRDGFIRVFCWCPCRPCKRFRTRLRFRRTLYPSGVNTASDKYHDRNGSMMHTVTDYVDTSSDVNGTPRQLRCTGAPRQVSSNKKEEDFV